MRVRNAVLCGLLGLALAGGNQHPAAASDTAGRLPCEATSSSAIGTLVNFSGVPRRLVAGEDLSITATVDCPGSFQASLKGMNLQFINDQGIRVSFAPRTAELLATAGTRKTYRVVVPTGGGLLPEGEQLLTARSLVMEDVPRFPTGVRQPTRVTHSRSYAAEQLSLPPDVQMHVESPDHTAPHPQLATSLLAGSEAEIRMPAWGPGAVLDFRWETGAGTVVSTQRSYVAQIEDINARVVVTGTWPDGSVAERRSTLVPIQEGWGGFNDVTLEGEAVPNGGQITAHRSNPRGGTSNGWYRISADGGYPPMPAIRSATLTPEVGDIGGRFQFIEGSRSAGASPIVTVTAAPPPGDRRTGFVHDGVLVDTKSQLTARLQPGYVLTAANPWQLGTASYRWLRDGKVVPGATGKGYRLSLADVGHDLQAAVATDQPGYSPHEVRTSTVRVPLARLRAGIPRLQGVARVGTRLKVSNPGWTTGTTFTYQWLRNRKIITGSTASTYVLQARDHGAAISVKVTGKRARHTTATRESTPTTLVNYGRLTTAAPSVGGTMRAGKFLTARTGRWTAGTTFRYQWLRNGRAVRGAHHARYRLGAADRGSKISVRVTGSKSGFMGATRTSPARRVAG